MKTLILGLLLMTIVTAPKASPALAQDEAAIRTIVESVGNLADTNNFEILEQLYADEIEVDYTSLAGGEVELKSPQALMTQWASILPGFDLTRHNLSNIKVKLNGNKAEVTASVVADHYVNDLFWQVSGNYLYRLERSSTGWKITSHTFNLTDEAGTREVFGPASDNAAKHPSPYIIRQKTGLLVTEFLQAVENKDVAKLSSFWAKDIVYDMPCAKEGLPKRLNGKDEVTKFYADSLSKIGKTDLTSQLVMHPMQNPEMIFVEFQNMPMNALESEANKQQYAGLFHIENGKIKLFRKYFAPQ